VREDVDVLIIAPHPDDEVLLAAGVLARTLGEGKRAAVILMTSGGYTCERNGPLRESETVEALTTLGMNERDIHFLGYPDGYLAMLGTEPLLAIERLDADGMCRLSNTTSASHGFAHTDEHTARTGTPAPFTAEALSEDLAALLARLKPRDVYLPHPIDDHPDHAATYAFFRRAVDLLDAAPPIVHRGVIHAGRCWPGDCTVAYAPDLMVPPLPGNLSTYLPTDRVPVDPLFKFGVIARYVSQTGPTPSTNWLATFAKEDEHFYSEQLQRSPDGWMPAPHPGTVATTLHLDFSKGPTLRLDASRFGGCDNFEVTQTPDAITLQRFDAKTLKLVRSWARPKGDGAKLSLRIDPRSTEIAEWTLLGPEGFLGQAVIPHCTPMPHAVTRAASR